MKKLYLLLLLLITTLSFGQGTPIMTIVADGDCSGGTPKVLEIYAHGTVDFSNYTLQKAPNGGSWGNDLDLSPLGTVTDAFVYIYNEGNGGSANPGVFATEFPNASAGTTLDASSSSALGINGDDPLRIIETATGTVVDVFGDGDGTGTSWEYKDGYVKRNNGTGPDPAFVETNWTGNNGALDHLGLCQGGPDSFEAIIGVATYTPPTTVSPVLVITSPTNNQEFSPVTTDVDVVFTVQNFNVAQTGGDGYIKYTFDSNPATDKYDTNPITLTGLTAGTSHTITMELVDNTGASLNPAVTSTVAFSIKDYVQVTTLADLRAGNIGDYYHFTGEAFVTGGKAVGTSGSMVGFIQDGTAGIAAFVPAGTTTNQPDDGDGVSDIKGQLSEYHGLLQISLIEDFTMTGNNQIQTPQVVTIADYLANNEDYESQLIKFENVTIDGNGDTEFQANTSYDVTDGTDTVILRTYFPDIENVTIPTTAVNLTGIAGQYNANIQIYPRDDDDIEEINAIAENNIAGLNIYPNPVTDHNVFVSSNSNDAKQIVIYNVLGKVVLSQEVDNNQAVYVGHLQAGVYMMKIIENDRVALQKLIIK
jgi:hypothetical protein